MMHSRKKKKHVPSSPTVIFFCSPIIFQEHSTKHRSKICLDQVIYRFPFLVDNAPPPSWNPQRQWCESYHLDHGNGPQELE